DKHSACGIKNPSSIWCGDGAETERLPDAAENQADADGDVGTVYFLMLRGSSIWCCGQIDLGFW
ncbi:MAG: hypothetical protein WCA42_19015, partial [Desulfobacterales bacterium]